VLLFSSQAQKGLEAIVGKNAFFYQNDGTRNIPGQDSQWSEWVSAARTRNFCLEDPLLDWLDEFGEAKGFLKDTASAGYDDRTDFLKFVLEQGNKFEAAVFAHLERHAQVVRIARDGREVRQQAGAERTWEAMVAETEIIAQGILWNPETQTYGAADLLVRSDVLARLFPEELSATEAATPARDISGATWHYRVVDVKFTTLDLLVGGHGGSGHLEYMAQVWLYNEALGRVQGFTPPCAYLLGRGWKQRDERGSSALERLEHVDRDHTPRRSAASLGDTARAACDWVRRMRREGAKWEALPAATVPELRPRMRSTEDAPWHQAKQRIAAQTLDLTTLPRVTPKARDKAMAAGVKHWTDPRCSAAMFEINGATYTKQVDAVIAANHSPADGGIVFPLRVTANEPKWRTPAPVEFYVDFETVSDLDDDFSVFPEKGGQPLIFMIGCGHLVDPKDLASWTFRVFTADRLSEDDERRVIEAWLEHMGNVCATRSTMLERARVFHWSPAELVTLATAYNSAAARHGFPPWDSLPWVDLLKDVVKAEPVAVRGAFGFGLKAIAKAMQRAGIIATNWGDGPTDGLGAMVGAWWCNREATKLGSSMLELDLMRSIAAYNEVDCRVMAEVLHFLRTRR
jgi:hypothetical protein